MIRLLEQTDDGELRFSERDDWRGLPAYAILSHTWSEKGEEEEVLYQDIKNGVGRRKTGFRKLLFCLQQARDDGLRYCWVDTCCIDKTNMTELDEAINSMFRWYRKSAKCYAYLSDVPREETNARSESSHERMWEADFKRSRWFTRGWTLQELIAPANVEFFSKNNELLGDKASLKQTISEITAIATRALEGASLEDFSVPERMSWIELRQTGRPEDRAHCLIGIFDVYMSTKYGIGEEKAFDRLRRKILKADPQFHPSQSKFADLRSRDHPKHLPATRYELESFAHHTRIKTLIDSLRFDQIEARRSTIKRAHRETCRWLLTSPAYVDWLDPDKQQENGGLLWIKGKPGSGKSTIMKFALEDTRKRIKDKVLISFFFNAHGSPIERSTVGAYRTLLFQLLHYISSSENILAFLDEIRWDIDTGLEWTVELLEDLFREVVQCLGESTLVCFVDGLDECDEMDIRDLIPFLESVCEDALADSRRVNICLASRHYPNIEIKQGLGLVLEDQAGHRQDIADYLASELRIGHNDDAESIRSDMLEQASGWFLWVVLAVRELNIERDRGPIVNLRRRLDELSRDRHELFQDILTRDSRNQAKLILCIQWVLFARKPLSALQLFLAVQSDDDDGLPSRLECSQLTDADLHKAILDMSKGLVEITKSERPTVQFIHESVRDILLESDGLSRVLPQLGDNLQGQSHVRLARCCQRYANFVRSDCEALCHEIETDATTRYEMTSKAFPFLEYAMKNTLFHVDKAQESGLPQEHFLQSFDRDVWLRLINVVEEHEARHYLRDPGLLYILADRGMSNLIRIHPSSCPHLHAETERYRAPLFAALAAGHQGAVFALLEMRIAQRESDPRLRAIFSRYAFEEKWRGNLEPPSAQSRKILRLSEAVRHANSILLEFLAEDTTLTVGEGLYVSKLILRCAIERGDLQLVSQQLCQELLNVSLDDGRTALTSAAHYGSEPIAEYLLNYGAEIDARDKNGLSALYVAIDYGNTRIAKLLLDRGANISALDWGGQSALHIAASYENDYILKLLLDRGADINALDSNGQSALHLSTRHTSDSSTKLLLSSGADINLLDNDGRSVLHSAAKYGSERVTKLLLDSGADVNALGSDGQSALHLAVKYRNELVAKLLLDYGADIVTRDKRDRSVLQLAIRDENEYFTMLLLHYGAKPDALDLELISALRTATSERRMRIAESLLRQKKT